MLSGDSDEMNEQLCYFHVRYSKKAYAIVRNNHSDIRPVCLSCLEKCIELGFVVVELLPPFYELVQQSDNAKKYSFSIAELLVPDAEPDDHWYHDNPNY